MTCEETDAPPPSSAGPLPHAASPTVQTITNVLSFMSRKPIDAQLRGRFPNVNST
jgi:hypothetical protein